MFEKEEETLKEMKGQLEQMHLPLDEADAAIFQGFERAKRDKAKAKKKRKQLFSLLVAAVLFLTFITSIRVSPAFANAVAAIPGMEKFVHLLQYDKGLDGIFQNDYYQKVGATQTINGLTLTIDGVILDETGMNLYYTLASKEGLETLRMPEVELKNKEGIPPSGISYGGLNIEEKTKEVANRIVYTFPDTKLFTELSFTLDMDIPFQGEELSFSLPFELKENVRPGRKIPLNKEVEIDSQKFTIKEVTIYPLRVAVKIDFDETNTKKILSFEDMRLEDENGEVWGSIQDGVVSYGSETYFLQSNYFEEPEKLYLRINKLQALDLDEATFVIDTEKGEILNRPKDDRLQLEKSSQDQMHLIMPDKEGNPMHHYHIFSSGKDADGKEVNISSTGMTVEEGIRNWSITFKTTDYKNPISLEITNYPSYITGNVKIELK